MRITDEFKVGIAIVLGLVILVIGIFFLKGINVFSKSRSFYAFYENTNGLTPGSPVTINGFQIGQVRTLELDVSMGGLVKVDLYIENESLNIPIDTKAQIYSADLLGTKGVMFLLGDTNVFIKAGDTIASIEQEELMDVIKNYINPLEKQAGKLIDQLKGAIATFETTAKRIDTTAQIINKKTLPVLRRKITTTLESVNDFIAVIQNQTVPKLNKAVDTYTSLGKKVDSINLKSITDKGDTLLAELNTLAKTLNSDTGTIGKLINTDEMHNELVETTNTLQELLIDIKTNPNKYVRVSMFEKRTYEEKTKDKEDKKRIKQEQKQKKKDAKANSSSGKTTP